MPPQLRKSQKNKSEIGSKKSNSYFISSYEGPVANGKMMKSDQDPLTHEMLMDPCLIEPLKNKDQPLKI